MMPLGQLSGEREVDPRFVRVEREKMVELVLTAKFG